AGNAAVDITATQTQLCAGDSITLDAGAGFATYSWLNSNSNTQTLKVDTAGAYIVNVTVSNGQCTSSGADTVVITAGVTITAPLLTYDSTICTGDSITVLASPSNYTSYLWSNGSTTASAVGSTGLYSVTVSNTGLCGTASASVNASGVALPDAGYTAANAVLTANTTGATYQWYVDGGPINNATGSTFTAVQTGSYTLQVTVNGCSSTSAPQQIVINGIEAVNSEFELTVYPNPVNDVVKIKCNTTSITAMGITIQSLDGRIMLPTELTELHSGANMLQRDLSSLAGGIYLMHLKGAGVNVNFKIIKQ
ncbi:MAG: T9SS type A sorting domain-containing protein, partial [Chitinophagales bacterium]|nr:T9SS type A sorting domain-containing protein [Chitinophagales bacterium]